MSILILSSTVSILNPLPKTNAVSQGIQIDHANDYMNKTNSDGSVSLVPYVLSQSYNTITVQSKQGSFVFNNGTCNISYYNSTSVSGQPIIPFDTYRVMAKLNGTTTWNNVDVINTVPCISKIFTNGNDITIQSTKSVAGAGTFQINYTKHAGRGTELSFKAVNQNPSWTNYHIGITETLSLPRYVTLGNQTLDLSLYNNTTLSRTWLNQYHSQIISVNNQVRYDMGLAWNNVNDITIQYRNNQASLSIDYTYNTPILQPNGTILIDPVLYDISGETNCGTGTTCTQTITVAGNSNRAIVALVATWSPAPGTTITSSVTGASNPFTKIKEYCDESYFGSCISAWISLSPAAGSNTITATMSASEPHSWIGLYSLYNVDQVTGYYNNMITDKGNSNNPSDSITPTSTNSLLMDAIVGGASLSSPSQTQGWIDNHSYGNFGSSYVTNLATINPQTFSWGATGGGWAHLIVEIKGAAGTSIILSPSSGPVGTTVNVSGSGFSASSSITVQYNGVTQSTTGTCVTDSLGNLPSTNNCDFTVPSSSGTNTVTATDSSGKSASATFTVGNGITSINGDTTPAQVIQGVAGNTTVSTSSGTTTINVGSKVLVNSGNITSTARSEFKISAGSGVAICIGTGC